jgi:membrane protein implicated in regulation of membrane protease activity
MNVGNGRYKQVDSSWWLLLIGLIIVGVLMYWLASAPPLVLGIYAIIALVAVYYVWSTRNKKGS